MLKPSIHELVYRKTFPRPKQGDPTSFYTHIQRHIVGEVRIEVQIYYGALDTLEAQYPGYDYTYPPHRRRMSRYPWHRRLFRVFDELGLTNSEILELCQWEGTRAAKEKYEREAQTEVRSTTLDLVVAAPRGTGPRAVFENWSGDGPTESSNDSELTSCQKEDEVAEPNHDQQPSEPTAPASTSNILDLLRTAVQARSDLEASVATTQAWEQWLKEALERHEMDIDTLMAEIQNIDAERSRSVNELERDLGLFLTPSSPASNHTYDQLHDMLDQLQSDNTRLAVDNAALASYLRRSQTEAAR
ncbi:hypothetical protein PV10_00678 [Exophiala mesophila]|uniref:Uncharacterized protein n=1 Tax=Exophiala mesophila TaxID=212818 RepID=A0A0D2AD68_EXOME|nr:uncharacterized protein PV10_00678 [Exophiala mesophila]KIV96863.1 hypothetical protein PV10_00678 [Exophiala mesophila]